MEGSYKIYFVPDWLGQKITGLGCKNLAPQVSNIKYKAFQLKSTAGSTPVSKEDRSIFNMGVGILAKNYHNRLKITKKDQICSTWGDNSIFPGIYTLAISRVIKWAAWNKT